MINPMMEVDCQPQIHSRCEVCEYYFQDKIRSCWFNTWIPVYTWAGYDDPKEFNCQHFKSIINQPNNEFVFRDYESMPVKEYSNNKYRFNSKGERV